MASIIMNGKIRYLTEGEILYLPDHYGNMIKVKKEALKAGDKVVVYRETSKDGMLMSKMDTPEVVVFTVRKTRDYGTSYGRVYVEEIGGSYHEDLVFKLIEMEGK